jgi:hypothetical protein
MHKTGRKRKDKEEENVRKIKGYRRIRRNVDKRGRAGKEFGAEKEERKTR